MYIEKIFATPQELCLGLIWVDIWYIGASDGVGAEDNHVFTPAIPITTTINAPITARASRGFLSEVVGIAWALFVVTDC